MSCYGHGISSSLQYGPPERASLVPNLAPTLALLHTKVQPLLLVTLNNSGLETLQVSDVLALRPELYTPLLHPALTHAQTASCTPWRPCASPFLIPQCPIKTHLEAGDTLNNASNDVELLLGSLVVVSLPLQPDPDSSGRGSDTSGPDGLVESRRDSDVLDLHGLLRKLDNGLDGLGGLCLSAPARHLS